MGRIIIIISIIILTIILINVIIISGLYFGYLDEGLVIKAKPYVWIFAHGNYQMNWNLTNMEHYHLLYLNDDRVPTDIYTESLYLEGYNKIWLASCHTGDSPYVRFDTNGNFKKWADYIDRVDSSGEIIPIFTGVNFVRLKWN